MHTEIVDEKTFIIKNKAYEVGDALELTEEEEALLANVREMEAKRGELTQMLVTTCHLADKNFVPEIRQPAHDYSMLTLELSYKINIIFSMVEARLGGILPLQFNEEKTKIVVRERDIRKREELNYTVQAVMRSLAMTDWDDQRKMAIHMAGGKKEDVRINCSQHTRFKIQPIEFPQPDVEAILKATSAILETRPGLQTTLLMRNEDSAVIIPKDLARQTLDRWKSIVKFARHFGPKNVGVITRKSTGPGNEYIETYVSFISQAKEERTHYVLKMTLVPRSVEIGDRMDGFGAPQEELYAQLLS